jgi:signal transduction histidine kinase
MKQGDFGVMPEESKAAIEEGLSSDEKGVQTVQEILNAANIRKGTVQYDMKSFDLSKLVADIVTNVSSTAKEKGLELKSVIDNEVNVTGDQIQLREVVKNLVDNAVHYTKQGSVMVSVLKKNRKALVSVKDTGKGLTEDAKKVLFTEGGRGQDSVKYNTDSTGYGLFIVKGIVSAHKGRVWAESEGEGKGSTFFVELPL